jgi:hypothetical protein
MSSDKNELLFRRLSQSIAVCEKVRIRSKEVRLGPDFRQESLDRAMHKGELRQYMRVRLRRCMRVR